MVIDMPYIMETLQQSLGYIDGNHDEGCEFDPEYGQQTFEREVDHEGDEAEERGEDDWTPRQWPDEKRCNCGNDELTARIKNVLSSYELSTAPRNPRY